MCTNKFLNKQCLPEDEVLKQYSLCGRIQRSIYASIELRFQGPINGNRISFKFNSNKYFRNRFYSIVSTMGFKYNPYLISECKYNAKFGSLTLFR